MPKTILTNAERERANLVIGDMSAAIRECAATHSEDLYVLTEELGSLSLQLGSIMAAVANRRAQ
jgi:hypothetical protein